MNENDANEVVRQHLAQNKLATIVVRVICSLVLVQNGMFAVSWWIQDNHRLTVINLVGLLCTAAIWAWSERQAQKMRRNALRMHRDKR
jgi:arginine exporter protein ArgO